MAAPRGLHALARLHGVQTAYHGNDGRRVAASPDALLSVLAALGVPVADGVDLLELVAQRARERWERVIEPVVVAWEGGPESAFLLRLPASVADRRARVVITLEAGGEVAWETGLATLDPAEEEEIDGRAFGALRVPLPALPAGYHDLALEVGGARHEALLISAPRRAEAWTGRRWGLFAPLHALWERGEPRAPDEDGPGPGDAPPPTFYTLGRLAGSVARHGGSVVGTLPVLAAFLDRPYEPSPYAPVSRLFWNELYVDPDAAPGRGELADGEILSDVEGSGNGGGVGSDRPGSSGGDRAPDDLAYLDPRAVMSARRPVLEALARRFFRDGEPAELASFRARNPRADDYARFRAVVERLGEWGEWPDRLRAGDVRAADCDDVVVRYHLYVQWLAERQLAEVTERAASRGVDLYLDLAMGVHPSGYDIWRDRPLFARGASAGAPPDPLAPGGQNWGFPPLHPEASRLDRHAYFVASIRNHLRFARVLRVDHVMQLHRMFWVPGDDARQGVYVRYPVEELYAILCLESRRAGGVIVGEDLGTVPRAVRRTMRRRGLPGMYVVQFELTEPPGSQGVLVPRRVPAGAVASVGTHDTATFAGWWRAGGVELRGRVGLGVDSDFDFEGAGGRARARARGRGRTRDRTGTRTGTRTGVEARAQARAQARAGAGAGEALGVLGALHRFMGRSEAGLVLATMEDLWLEPEPQNEPGTTGERNWRRRSRRPLEALDAPDVAGLLDELNRARRESG